MRKRVFDGADVYRTAVVVVTVRRGVMDRKIAVLKGDLSSDVSGVVGPTGASCVSAGAGLAGGDTKLTEAFYVDPVEAGPSSVLEYLQKKFSDFEATPRSCRTFIDNREAAIFFGYSSRPVWGSDEWKTYGVVGGYHCPFPVLIDMDRCNFRPKAVEQTSEDEFQVTWETDEVSTEPLANVQHVLDKPGKTKVVLLPLSSCAISSSASPSATSTSISSTSSSTSSSSESEPTPSTSLLSQNPFMRVLKFPTSSSESHSSSSAMASSPGNGTATSLNTSSHTDITLPLVQSPPTESSSFSLSKMSPQIELAVRQPLADRSEINRYIAEASPLSLWGQFVRLYPSRMGDEFWMERMRHVGDRGGKTMIYSEPAMNLSKEGELSIRNVLKNRRGFNLLVDSFVFAAMLNVEPRTVYRFLRALILEEPYRLPPHPMTVLKGIISPHAAFLERLVSAIPSRWIHFFFCPLTVYGCFSEVPVDVRLDLARLVVELKGEADLIDINRIVSLSDNDSGASDGSEDIDMPVTASGVCDAARPRRTEPSTQETTAANIVDVNLPLHRRRRYGTRRATDGSSYDKSIEEGSASEVDDDDDQAASADGIGCRGYLIDDISGGHGPGPVRVVNTMDGTEFRNVEIIHDIIDRRLHNDDTSPADDMLKAPICKCLCNKIATSCRSSSSKCTAMYHRVVLPKDSSEASESVDINAAEPCCMSSRGMGEHSTDEAKCKVEDVIVGPSRSQADSGTDDESKKAFVTVTKDAWPLLVSKVAEHINSLVAPSKDWITTCDPDVLVLDYPAKPVVANSKNVSSACSKKSKKSQGGNAGEEKEVTTKREYEQAVQPSCIAGGTLNEVSELQHSGATGLAIVDGLATVCSNIGPGNHPPSKVCSSAVGCGTGTERKGMKTNKRRLTKKYGRRRKRRRKDPNRPKHPISSYFFFLVDVRAQVAADNPDLNFIEVGRACAGMWKEMDAHRKAKYVKMADADRKRYSKEMAEYVAPPLSDDDYSDSDGDDNDDDDGRCNYDDWIWELPEDNPYYIDGRVAVPPSRWIVECNSRCPCAYRGVCENRMVSRGCRIPLEVVYYGTKGWGLRTRQSISRGMFVIEYLGELITSREAERRGRQYDAQRVSTLYDLDGVQDDNEYTLDASYYCSVARFMNHSCEPNLINYQVLIEHIDYHRPRIAFFALRDIAANEELTFDYRYPKGAKNIRCRCGAPSCKVWLN